jgi:hypothetical protein
MSFSEQLSQSAQLSAPTSIYLTQPPIVDTYDFPVFKNIVIVVKCKFVLNCKIAKS